MAPTRSPAHYLHGQFVPTSKSGAMVAPIEVNRIADIFVLSCFLGVEGTQVCTSQIPLKTSFHYVATLTRPVRRTSLLSSRLVRGTVDQELRAGE